MSWIQEIDPSHAVGPLVGACASMTADPDEFAPAVRVQSLRPTALRDHLQLYTGLMHGPGGLTPRERELVAITVSQENGCRRCAAHHLDALRRHERDPELLAEVEVSVREACLDERERAIADYAWKLTVCPQLVGQEDVDELRSLGLHDADVLHLNLLASYFNFANRIALGLGVDACEDEAVGCPA